MSNTIGVTFRTPEKAEPYLAALRELGAPYTDLTPEKPRSITGLAGLLVTGGGADINPARYSQKPHPETDGPPDDARDEMEAGLIAAAIAANLPLLAICRGMQMFNVVHNGALTQHLPQAARHRVKPPPGRRHEIVHSINVKPGTTLAAILGVTEHPVNSRHHQGVDLVGHNLIVSARAPDGVVEALERPGHRFAVACQWHPEESIRTNPGDRKIFEAFLAAL